MFVKDISWIDYSCKEATVIISDGTYNVICFSHPCSYAVGQIVTEPLECFDADNIVVSNCEKYEVIKTEECFTYQLNGKLINKTAGIVQLGEIVIRLNGHLIPGDIDNGSYVSFTVSRLDLW